MSGTVAIVLFVVGLVAAIMLHEWGHFVTARRFGMRADRFFLGFGPTLWSTRVGETEYGVKAIPAGGFVRIKGMSPTDERLAPVPDVVFGPEALAEARRSEVGGFEGDGHLPGEDPTTRADVAQPVPEATWQRLEAELERRGAPRATRGSIVRRARANVDDETTPQRARALLTEIITTEVGGGDDVGDLRYRLLQGDRGRFFPDRPAWQRAIVLSAGSAVHFVIAIVLLLTGFLAIPQPTGEITARADQILADSPAASAGLEAGDRIIAVDGEQTSDFDAIREAIEASPGEQILLTVERDGRELRLSVVPEPTTDPETGATIGRIGYAPTLVRERLSVGDALYATFVGPASVPRLTVASLEALVDVFSPDGLRTLFGQLGEDGTRSADQAVASPIGLASVTAEGTAAGGAFFLIGMLVSINIFVGVFNILPLPPLDGGHLAVLGIERGVNAVRARRGRPTDFTVDPRAVAAVAIPVLVVLGSVFFAVVWLDLTNPIQLP